MFFRNQDLVRFYLICLCVLSNRGEDSGFIFNQTISEDYTEPGLDEIVENDPDINSSKTHISWMFSNPSSELNQTFENFTLYAEMMRAQTESVIPFDPNYIYDEDENEVMPNISRRSYPLEIESNPSSILNSYIIEFCENATKSDHQELLTYIKMNDLNETLYNWFTWVIDDLWMPVNETHGRWILITNETTNQAIEDLALLSPICYVVADAKIETSVRLPRGLDRIDQIDLPLDGYYDGAWINKQYYDGRGVKVFVFDGGLYHSHQEFKNKPAGWAYNTYDHYNCPRGNCYQKNSILYGNNDGNGHGTHVAGTVGGKNVGVAPGCMIHGVKVLDNSGNGIMGYLISAISRQMTEFRNSIKAGIPVIASMSLSGPRHSSCDRAIRNLYDNGILSVVAAGNYAESASLYSPAGEPKAITVMGSYVSGNVDKKYSGSNTGGDIYAPGVSIYSAFKSSSSSYRYFTGTSIATPHVSGILACLYQYNKKMSTTQAVIKLFTYAKLIFPEYPPKYGNIITGEYGAFLPQEKPHWVCHRGTPNGHFNYCKLSNCKCLHGEGDCDWDSQCVSGTYCGNNYGTYFGMASWVDVCVSDSYVPPQPTSFPTFKPIPKPTMNPIPNPTTRPTLIPIPEPTMNPIPNPTTRPTLIPIPGPTMNPIPVPSSNPTLNPIPLPTGDPTLNPIPLPTLNPIPVPTMLPIPSPTNYPSLVPTNKPTSHPTEIFRYLVATYNSNPLLQTVSPTNKPTKSPVYIETIPPTLQDSSGAKLNSSNMLWIMLVVLSCSIFQVR